MTIKRRMQNKVSYRGSMEKRSFTSMHGSQQEVVSINEMPLVVLDQEIGRWITVVRPSRASLTYERME